jgi:osmoprotectant transport system permease protein
MDPSLRYEAAARETVNVISAFSTDGRLRAFHLRVLEDDRHAIPPYDALVLASARLRERHPEALRALQTLEGRIDAEKMRHLNQLVDQEGKTPEQAAETFFAGD